MTIQMSTLNSPLDRDASRLQREENEAVSAAH